MDSDEDDRPAVKIELGPYSVQWLETDPGPCAVCGREVGWGPVGFKMDDPLGPVCDTCLLELNTELGMLLLMAHTSRELAHQATSAADPREHLVGLLTFAKVYDQGAKWPRRRIAATQLVDELLKKWTTPGALDDDGQDLDFPPELPPHRGESC